MVLGYARVASCLYACARMESITGEFQADDEFFDSVHAVPKHTLVPWNQNNQVCKGTEYLMHPHPVEAIVKFGREQEARLI